MFIFYALFYLSDSLNNKHVSWTFVVSLVFAVAGQMKWKGRVNWTGKMIGGYSESHAHPPVGRARELCGQNRY